MFDYNNVPPDNYLLMDLALQLASIEASQHHDGRYSSETVSAFYEFMLRKHADFMEALKLAHKHTMRL